MHNWTSLFSNPIRHIFNKRIIILVELKIVVVVLESISDFLPIVRVNRTALQRHPLEYANGFSSRYELQRG